MCCKNAKYVFMLTKIDLVHVSGRHHVVHAVPGLAASGKDFQDGEGPLLPGQIRRHLRGD